MLGVAFLPDFFDEFQRQRSSSAFVPVDSAAHEDVMWSEKCFNVRERNGSGLINYDKISVAYFVGVGGENILNELCVSLFDLDSDDGFVVVFR